jgi:fluoroquinolone resistance protein
MNCALGHSTFYRARLKKTVFRKSQLLEADFADCDLTESVFDDCDLSGAKFENTVLEKADLRTAFGYSIDPERNRIKKARFSLAGAAGLLDKYDIRIDGVR